MRDFEKMAKKALEERKNSEKELQERAEEIVERAIEFFKDIAVKSVHIEIDSNFNKFNNSKQSNKSKKN